MPEALTLAVARSRSGRGRGRRCRRLPARPRPRSVSAGVGPGSSRGRQSAFGLRRRTPEVSAHVEPPLPGLPDARGIIPVGRRPSPGPWRQAPEVSTHIWSPLPFGPPLPPGWRQPPDVRCEHSRRELAAARRRPGATSAPPTCANVRMPLSGADGSAPQTAHIGPPPPRAEPRRGPPPAGGAQRSCPRREPRPACTRGTNFLAAPMSRRPANWGSAASRRARVGNRVPCVHAGRVFRRRAAAGGRRGSSGGPRGRPAPVAVPFNLGPSSPSLTLDGPSARGRHGSLGTPPQSAARGDIKLPTLAANSRSEHSHPDSAAMEGQQGHVSQLPTGHLPAHGS